MFLSVTGTLLDMNDNERQTVAKRVTAARTAKGWSKERLAERAGITTTTLRRIEDGLRVQDAKLQMALDALGLGRDAESPDSRPEEHWSPMLFALPPEIERGYNETVRFTSAVVRAAPELRPEATRLMVQAANLFARAGDIILMGGGDGDADDAGSSAPMKLREVKEHEVDVAAYDPDDTK